MNGIPSKADRWSLRYRDEIIDTFEKDIFPYIGKRPIAEIKPLELLETLRKIEKRGALVEDAESPSTLR